MVGDSEHEPKFSVLLPTHNRPDVLPFAIRSVLDQTVHDFELLVVGDGCTDHTSDIVRDFADPRIRWFDLPKAPNFGYANRNIALRSARGAYIAFMAHDDLWLPDHLELLRPFMERDGVELAYSRPLWVIPLGLIAPSAFNLEHPPTLESFLGKERNGIPAACVVHRRECFAKYGYWDEALPSCGDWDMWARIIEGGGRKNFAYLSEPTCLHFRANWHTDTYLVWHKLTIWKRLHAQEGLLPTELKIAVEDGVLEQEAVWREMSADPQEWTKQVRSAIRQVLDQRVAQANELTEALLTLRDELTEARLPHQPSLGCDVPSLIEPLRQLAIAQASPELEQSVD
jgi:glycosyltransferase involved in cell wall biosynthesis